MNKRISIGVCISLIAIACTVTFVITWTVSLNMYNDMIPELRRDEISAKLREIDSYVRNNCLHNLNEDELAYGIFSGYISGVGDKNTMYMTVSEYSEYAAHERGQLVSSGIRVEKEDSGYITIVEVYPGSDAELQGVQKGDLITSIDGTDVLSVGAEAALTLLFGEENTRFRLNIMREGQIIDYSLIRQSIDIISVDSEITEKGIGIARISTFNNLTAAQFKSALEEFIEAEVKAILIDLRNNADGFYTPSVQNMVNDLVSADVIAFSEHKGGIRKELIVTDDNKALPDEMQDIPIIVLINSETSGAGELFAAVLKSHASAQLIGENTAGNPFIQNTQVLNDGSAIRVTAAQVILSSGLSYAGTGLSPDYEVKAGDIDDAQLQKAFEVLETII
ncbi:MAG: S41 family peptidase [Oscillospiraceae bacterium]|nr:S41 family peptidase [Oscillospiraceae bacterium]